MSLILLVEIVYILLLVIVCLRIVYDTRDSAKALAYLLFAVFVPVWGMIFYFMFGINYRKQAIYSRKLIDDEKRLKKLTEKIGSSTRDNLAAHADEISDGKKLVYLLLRENQSPLTSDNQVKLLINGKQKFDEVFKAIREARDHIHLEYYIIENDWIGNRLKELLIEKARGGIKVRLIYDDFGSRSIRGRFVKELRKGGVEAYPFNRVRFLYFANRINYRNHRKIIVIDSKIAFTGGINISDRYINRRNRNGQYWRDTHIRIDGPGIFLLQHIFISDWNFCSGQKLDLDHIFFSAPPKPQGHANVQIAYSGPDSPNSTIMFSFLKAINLAQTEILLTTPYLIPDDSVMDSLTMAALAGVTVKIMIPETSDSRLVSMAASTNYGTLLRAGVEIYCYQKGFIHAKTLVVDNSISVVGTANMDHRSFYLNFEVNAIVYSSEFAQKLRSSFYRDLDSSTRIAYEQWISRPFYKRIVEKTARLFSPLL